MNREKVIFASPTLPPDIPLQITRSWLVDNGRLVLRFGLKNKTPQPIELGALGIPMIFNNILTGRSLEEAVVSRTTHIAYSLFRERMQLQMW